MPKIKSVRINMKGPLEGLFISDIPESARLVVLIGPNGSGKTSLLDAFKVNERGGTVRHDPALTRPVDVTCHNFGPPYDLTLYMRSAYRTEHVVNIQALLMVIPAFATSLRSAPRSNTQDMRVNSNFQNLLHNAHLNATHSTLTWTDAVMQLFSPVSQRLERMFPYLKIPAIEYPTGGNESGTLETLCFEKAGTRYRYEALSAGEKEVFDLLFDLDRSAHTNQDALYCIDEPELHLHTELQARLLDELLDFLPSPSQLWIATHSIGIIRRAMELQRSKPGEVIFLNCGELTSNGPQTLKPATADRALWKSALHIALHDLADLVAPEEIIICEGKPLATIPPPAIRGKPKNAAFDAEAYGIIFSGSHPKTDFVSAGCSNDILKDSIKLEVALNLLVPGVKTVKLIDHDNRSTHEVAQLRKSARVLSRYSIENYLWSDEILEKLMQLKGCSAPDQQAILASKARLVGRSPGALEDPMEYTKDIEGLLYQECMKIPQLRGLGGNTNEFALRELAPLVTEDTNTYRELEQDIFS